MSDVYDRYWKADDGRIYSSKRQMLVDASDAEYAEYQIYNPTVPWPRDGAGQQTDAVLQSILNQHETIFVNNTYYAANVRWRKEQAGITVTAGGSTFPLKTDDRSQAKVNGARIVSGEVVDPQETTPWTAADGTIHPLTAADLQSMSDQLQQHINGCFAIYKEVVAGIDGGTITTRDQIDAAFDTLARIYDAVPAGQVWKVRRRP